MPDVISPLDHFNPECLLRAWQRQNYATVIDTEFRKMLEQIQQRAVTMLTSTDEAEQGRLGLQILESFFSLKVAVELRKILVFDLPHAVRTSMLVMCSLSNYSTPADQWGIYQCYHRNPDFRELLRQ